MKEKIIKGIYGLIVGDALGVPFEFVGREELENNKITDMVGYGTHNQPKGIWSDDSTMTLCTYKNIVKNESLNDLMNDFVNWATNGYMTPFGKSFDIGITTSNSLNRYIKGIKPSGLDSEYSNGNGSLMRILPLTLLYKFNTLSRIEKIEEYSKLTHSHKRSIISCVFYVEYAIKLLKGIDKYVAYNETVEFIEQHYSNDEELFHFKRILNNVHKLSRYEIRSTGYVIDSLEASLWCFLNHNNYKDVVLEAVNLGNDTDTIAAISGGLAGLIYEIPNEWINSLQNMELIKEVLK